MSDARDKYLPRMYRPRPYIGSSVRSLSIPSGVGTIHFPRANGGASWPGCREQKYPAKLDQPISGVPLLTSRRDVGVQEG